MGERYKSHMKVRKGNENDKEEEKEEEEDEKGECTSV